MLQINNLGERAQEVGRRHSSRSWANLEPPFLPARDGSLSLRAWTINRSHGFFAKRPVLKRRKVLADVDVVEKRVYDYGSGTVSPGSRLPHCTVVALAMLAPPVINDLESQNRSVPFPLIWVEGFVPVATATEDRLTTTKPP